MSRIREGFRLLVKSWRVILTDPEILLLAGLGLVLMVGAFGGLFYAVFGRAPHVADFRFPRYLWLVPIYAATGIVGGMTGAAIMAMAMIRLRGGDPSLRDGVRVAWSRFPQIVAWSLVATTFGILIQLILERLKLAGRIAEAFLGLTWALATMFVIPVLVFERVGVLDAVKRSASLFKQRWGEEMSGLAGLGIAFVVLSIPVGILVGVLAAISLRAAIAAGIVSFALLMISVQAIGGVFNAALYQYAVTGEVTGSFTEAEIGERLPAEA